jgi:hypothetical protein
MGQKLQLTLAAKLDSLPAFRSFIGEACQEAKLDDESCYDMIQGGFGLYFMYRSMDSISYDSTEGCNTLTMVKQLGILEPDRSSRE